MKNRAKSAVAIELPLAPCVAACNDDSDGVTETGASSTCH
jgi:hypothetical protein